MRTAFLLLCVSVLTAQQTATRKSEPGGMRPISPTGSNELTFADEFDEPNLDLAKWAPHPASAASNRSPAVEYWSDAVTLGGGRLRISGRSNAQGYILGAVTTFGLFSQMYGRFEIRSKAAVAEGIKPVVRLSPIPLAQLPEMLFFPAPGPQPGRISLSNSWGSDQTERSFGDSLTLPRSPDGFHTITLDWDPEQIIWSIDGKKALRSIDGIPHQPMFLSLEMLVQGSPSQRPHVPGAEALLEVDYVRIYRSQ